MQGRINYETPPRRAAYDVANGILQWLSWYNL